jgi:signal transduction histidine kinase
MIWNWLQRHPRLVDWALVLLALATVATAAHDRYGPGFTSFLVLGPVLSLPLLARRTHPVETLLFVSGATAIAVAGWGTFDPLPMGIALFTVADRCERRLSLIAGGGSVAVLAAAVLSEGWNLFAGLGRLLPFVVAWLVGDSLRARRAYVSELEEKAARLERERELEAANAVAEEQARIARELHDVIAHNLSVMVVQASAADDAFDTRPQEARQAVRRVVTTGREALTELRRVLGAVRADGADYGPQPSLARLDELVRLVRDSGLDVSVRVDGTVTPLPAALDLSAYRIVQEALTNTLKHAHARRADIAIRYTPAELGVEVRDDGAGAAPNGDGGHGLIGMRERVNAFGGSLTTTSAPGRGFVVSATFPLAAA